MLTLWLALAALGAVGWLGLMPATWHGLQPAALFAAARHRCADRAPSHASIVSADFTVSSAS